MTATAMPRRIVVFSGSFNPPAAHHRSVAEELAKHFDEVVVVPGGPRTDRPTSGPTDPVHRAIMADLTFRGLPNVRVDHADLEHDQFTRTHLLDEKYRPYGEVWHAVGADMVRGGNAGRSFIHESWERGEELWRSLNFAIIAREGFSLDEGDLPPRHRLFSPRLSGASTEIRERVFRGGGIDGLVLPAVAEHIERYGLYRGSPPPRSAELNLSTPRPLVLFDEWNPEARRVAGLFASAPVAEANCILVIGGDGTMIRSIRQHWRLRLPFFGLNAGHRGHLLNDLSVGAPENALSAPLRVQMLPLFYIETVDPSGRATAHYAMNDAWVERASGQAAWLKVTIDGETRLPKLVGDGALVATAVGSTAYARSMGATPLLADAQAFLLVGSNVSEPQNWKSAQLPLDSEVSIEALDPVKRPIRAYVDASGKGLVRSLRARISRTAAVELVFAPGRDITSKLLEGLFPKK